MPRYGRSRSEAFHGRATSSGIDDSAVDSQAPRMGEIYPNHFSRASYDDDRGLVGGRRYLCTGVKASCTPDPG
ncbi:hypothetical protein C8Q79DRAFT_937657 [Trametes meyenii]|nr:hypothetical protein C8Q79DRAFT_937657 [Trametes meyenii]